MSAVEVLAAEEGGVLRVVYDIGGRRCAVVLGAPSTDDRPLVTGYGIPCHRSVTLVSESRMPGWSPSHETAGRYLRGGSEREMRGTWLDRQDVERALEDALDGRRSRSWSRARWT